MQFDELQAEIKKINLRIFTAEQIYGWVYKKNIQDINLWSNISKQNREILKNIFRTDLNNITAKKDDGQGTKKFLLELSDKQRIETVSIKEKQHFTLCLSTQVGCPLKCKFCATGQMGFIRNLTAGEIVCQILMMKKELPGHEGKLNIVFMGMGEPLLNYENLKRALVTITSKKGLSISPRNITVSTAGILNNIRCLEDDFPRIKLSFSLNASDQKIRQSLMPVAAKENLLKILDYFKNRPRKNRITFEYVLIKGVNDSIQAARKVSRLIRDIPCKINLIPYNEIADIEYESPDLMAIERFRKFLDNENYTTIVRWSRGKDIRAACGQLTIEDNKDNPRGETLVS